MLKAARNYIGTVTQVYKPFDFVTPDCPPETCGRHAVFLSWSLDLMLLFLFLNNTLTYLFDVSSRRMQLYSEIL